MHKHIYKWIWLIYLINNKANLQNLNVRQSFLLSDQAASNAADNLMLQVKIKLINFMTKLSYKLMNKMHKDRCNEQFAEAEENKINALNAQNQ